MIPLLPLPPDLPPTIGWSWAPSLRVAGQAGLVLARLADHDHSLQCGPPRDDKRYPKAADVSTPHVGKRVHMRAFPDGTGILWQGQQILPYPVVFARNGIVPRQDYATLVDSIAPHLPSWSGRIATSTQEIINGAQVTPWSCVPLSLHTQDGLDALTLLRTRLITMVTNVLVPQILHHAPAASSTIHGTLFSATMGPRGSLLPPSLDLQGLPALSDEAHLRLLAWQNHLAAALFEEAAREGWDHHCFYQQMQPSAMERNTRAQGMAPCTIAVFTLPLQTLHAISSHAHITAQAKAHALGLPVLHL